jgi:O-methyltransferase
VLRMDADWYDSVRCCLETLFVAVASGGYIIVDDYGTCYGAEQALNEFLALRGVSVKLVPDGRGGCHFEKPKA